MIVKRGLHRWLSIKTIKYIVYIPVCIQSIKNWYEFLLHYLGLSKRCSTISFRNGIKIIDNVGSGSGTVAVVFIRKHYGSIKGSKTIIDVGANIGVFSVYAASEEKGAQIYAYEPIIENYYNFISNIEVNNLKDRIIAYNQGVASKNEKREIFISRSPLHSMVNDGSSSKSIMTDCVTLEEILKINRIDDVDLLKMNCEGAEYEILYTTSKDIFKKIKEIRMEYHNLDENKNNIAALEVHLTSCGYKEVYKKNNTKLDGFIWLKRN